LGASRGRIHAGSKASAEQCWQPILRLLIEDLNSGFNTDLHTVAEEIEGDQA